MGMIYKTVERLKENLSQLHSDSDKIVFLQKVKRDKENHYLEPSEKNDQKIDIQETVDLINTMAHDKVIIFCEEQLDFLSQKNQIEIDQSQKVVRKTRISHEKQMVLLDRLGVRKHLSNAGLTVKDQAIIISLLIDKNLQNTREYLTYGFSGGEPKKQNKKKYYCMTTENVDYVDDLLKSVNYKSPL